MNLTPYTYEHLPHIGKGGPAHSLAGRADIRTESDSPGPGAYTTASNRQGGPAFSLSGRPDKKLESNSPGPGAYLFC